MTLALGGNVHLSYVNTGYADRTRVFQAISDLGWTYARENSADGVKALKDHFGDTLTVISPAGNGAVATAMLQAGTDILEGPNELFTKKKIVVGSKTLTSAADIAAYAVSVWDEVVAARKASGKPALLAGPSASLGDAAWAKQVATVIGKLKNQPDVQSLHVYPGNRSVAAFTTALHAAMAVADILSPGIPRLLTETGSWWDADPKVQAATGHKPTAPTDAVKLWPQYLTAIEAEGFTVALMYELIDEWVNGQPKGSIATKDVQEGRLGVLTHDFQDKPWTPILREEGRTRIDPTPWAVPIVPDPTARWQQVQARTGAIEDGLVGDDTLGHIELALNDRDQLAQENESLKQRLAGIAKMAAVD